MHTSICFSPGLAVIERSGIQSLELTGGTVSDRRYKMNEDVAEAVVSAPAILNLISYFPDGSVFMSKVIVGELNTPSSSFVPDLSVMLKLTGFFAGFPSMS